MPSIFHSDVFVGALAALPSLKGLKSLSVNNACMGELTAAAVSDVVGLRYLRLKDPNRAILQLLPDWVKRLRGTLDEIHLEVRVGSIPMVMLPYL
jgi:hypothetical protein